MKALRLTAMLGFAAATFHPDARADERERNAWPVVVRQVAPTGETEAWSGAGPFLFRQPVEGGTASGFRPFWVQAHDAAGDFRAGYFLYPIFSYTTDQSTYKWSVFELIRGAGRRSDAAAPKSVFQQNVEFEVWPFWFSRQTSDPAFSYRALFPIAGTLKNKLFFERASWVLFPLYAQSESHGAVTTYTPWPFIRVTRGAAHGYGFWPLFTWQERPGVSRDEFYLWPLGYNHTRQPPTDAPPGTAPRRDFGALPFYARSTGPGYINENYVWPFFGYTDRTLPNLYHETRYLWPLFVQGRGDDRYVNRWAPFYTHSTIKGYDKQWFGWPLVRTIHWNETERDLARTKTQFFYFVYWSETQRSATRPNTPAANLTHLWPLYSNWDNGAGRRQLQVPSLFEVFFPANEKVRQAWTPLFTLFRYEQRAPGDERTSLLWNAVTWERHDAEARSEFHLGPLLSVTTQSEGKRVAIGNGLFGFKRGAPATGWHMFWLDFPGKADTTNPASR